MVLPRIGDTAVLPTTVGLYNVPNVRGLLLGCHHFNASLLDIGLLDK